MTEQQEVFIRKLKITLLAILGPFTLALTGSAIADHFQIKNNREYIQAMKQEYVTREIMMAYYNSLRELTYANTKDIDGLNEHMDNLMKDVYRSKQRSAKPTENE
jgi:hypothetical protein